MDELTIMMAVRTGLFLWYHTQDVIDYIMLQIHNYHKGNLVGRESAVDDRHCARARNPTCEKCLQADK